jgi:hypothetical protein
LVVSVSSARVITLSHCSAACSLAYTFVWSCIFGYLLSESHWCSIECLTFGSVAFLLSEEAIQQTIEALRYVLEAHNLDAKVAAYA